jgi:hypothetical protein
MSASNSEKLKTNCDAVRIINSSSTLNSLTSSSSASLSTLSNSNVIKAVNNGAKLNNQQKQQNQHPYRHHQQQQLILRQHQQQQQNKNYNQQIQPKQQKQEIAAVNKQDYSAENFQIESQKLSSDVQKVLKQEQELQKQLYSGSNVAPGWLRVNHNSKVIYIR